MISAVNEVKSPTTDKFRRQNKFMKYDGEKMERKINQVDDDNLNVNETISPKEMRLINKMQYQYV